MRLRRLCTGASDGRKRVDVVRNRLLVAREKLDQRQFNKAFEHSMWVFNTFPAEKKYYRAAVSLLSALAGAGYDFKKNYGEPRNESVERDVGALGEREEKRKTERETRLNEDANTDSEISNASMASSSAGEHDVEAEERKVLVLRRKSSLTERDIWKIFSRYGKIKSVDTNARRGLFSIEFFRKEDAEEAVRTPTKTDKAFLIKARGGRKALKEREEAFFTSDGSVTFEFVGVCEQMFQEDPTMHNFAFWCESSTRLLAERMTRGLQRDADCFQVLAIADGIRERLNKLIPKERVKMRYAPCTVNLAATCIRCLQEMDENQMALDTAFSFLSPGSDIELLGEVDAQEEETNAANPQWAKEDVQSLQVAEQMQQIAACVGDQLIGSIFLGLDDGDEDGIKRDRNNSKLGTDTLLAGINRGIKILRNYPKIDKRASETKWSDLPVLIKWAMKHPRACAVVTYSDVADKLGPSSELSNGRDTGRVQQKLLEPLVLAIDGILDQLLNLCLKGLYVGTSELEQLLKDFISSLAVAFGPSSDVTIGTCIRASIALFQVGSDEGGSSILDEVLLLADSEIDAKGAEELSVGAQKFYQLQRLTDAEDLLRKCISVSQKDVKHSLEAALAQSEGNISTKERDTLAAFAQKYNDLGMILLGNGEYKEAEKALQKSLQFKSVVLDNTDPNLGNGHHNLGQVFIKLRKFADAEKHLLSALNLFRAVYKGDKEVWEPRTQVPNMADAEEGAVSQGESRVWKERVGTVMGHLGELYFARNDLEKAEKAILSALRLKKEVVPELYEKTLLVEFNNLASVFVAQQKYQEAIDTYNTLIEILASKEGENATSVAITKTWMANAYVGLGKLETASEIMAEGLGPIQQNLPASQQVFFWRRHSEILTALGRDEEARNAEEMANMAVTT